MENQSKTEVLKEFYAAINRNDIPAAIQFLDPQIERIEPGGFPSAGTYKGHVQLKAHISQGRETWAEGGCYPERFIVSADKIVVLLHVRVRLKGKQDWIDAHIADGFTFNNGKINFMRTFVEKQQALDWAGIIDAN